MKQTKPPSADLCTAVSPFLIGKNCRGEWVVQDQNGLRGGLFINRAEALRYAMFENGDHPEAVVMVPGVLELSMNRKCAPLTPSRRVA